MVNMNNQYPNNVRAAWYIIGFMMSVLILVSLLTGCHVTSYNPGHVYEDHPHSTEIYYHNEVVYFGYWDGFYYYYGKPHFYPWWYYYQFIPPYHYYSHSHINVNCDNGHYVYGHRGPIFNNRDNNNFTPTIKIRNKKDKSFVFPNNWKSNNSTRINKYNNYNTNKTNYNTNNKGNNGSKRTNKTTTTRRPKK